MKRDFLKCADGDNLQDCGELLWKVEAFAGDGDHEVGGEGGPDLDGDAVGGVGEEGAQTQVRRPLVELKRTDDSWACILPARRISTPTISANGVVGRWALA